LLSWSSGKDSAWTLHTLRQDPEVEVVGLLTSYNDAADRVAMHGVRRTLVEAQGRATGLPLWPVRLPWPCSNDKYEDLMRQVLDRARSKRVDAVAFGDLFLEDVRDYRIQQMRGTGIEPIFPLWSSETRTRELARDMITGGLRAVLTCVDPKQLDPAFAGREFDEALLRDLPDGIDPCGERGEFHTFCCAGPMYDSAIAVAVGERVLRDGFQFVDLFATEDGRTAPHGDSSPQSAPSVLKR
jgi:uncharacterized protein (TIGR00290 family)